MSRQFWDYDPLTGMERYLDYNPVTDSMVVEHRQDTTNVIEHNKRLVIEADHRQQMKDDWIKYAKVPAIVIMEWKQKFGVDFFNKDHWPRVMKLINSPDYRDVKTSAIHHDR